MFFIVSKIFGFVIQPLNLTLILLAVALLVLPLGRRRLSATATLMGFLVLGLSAWTSLGANLLSPLEQRFPRPALAPAKVDGIVVLGGGLEGQINLARGGFDMNSAGDRFVETAVLALRYPDARVLVSGGSGALMLAGEPEADTAERLLTALGIARDRLILENRSRNTEENARFSRELAQPRSGETWLLVTSAFHMPRSMGLFRKEGFEVVAWPADYRTSGREGVGLFVDNATDSLQNTTLGIREWIGLLAYYLTGKTDRLLPAP